GKPEIARAGAMGAGGGCPYPASVSEDVVRRSNEILHELRRTAQLLDGAAARLAALPMHLVAQVGRLRVGIVHGDATTLAGWSFAHDALDAAGSSSTLAAVQRAARVDVFASTHTCLAALRDFALDSGRLTLVNNGAAGLPNFAGPRLRPIVPIPTPPPPPPP